MNKSVILEIIEYFNQTISAFEKLPKSVRATAPESVLEHHNSMKDWVFQLNEMLKEN